MPIYPKNLVGDPSQNRLGKSPFFTTIWDNIFFRSTPHPVTVTARIITYLVGNPYKPSFATVTGWGVDPKYILFFPSIEHANPRVLVSKYFWNFAPPIDGVS